MTGKATTYAVMQERRTGRDGLDYFPTPPWASRALLEWAATQFHLTVDGLCWEPAAGGRHMADVLTEVFPRVHATDVFDYGRLDAVGSFVGIGADVVEAPGEVAWVITNPPFNLAAEFLDRACCVAKLGVALLLRTSWLEGGKRWEQIFSRNPPSDVLQFSGRVAMKAGTWDPKASTATSYAWFVWPGDLLAGPYPECRQTRLWWIDPQAQCRLTRADDVARFAGERAHG